MAANMWKNSLKNVESDKNKILYESLLDFFYSETVLTFCISLVQIRTTEAQSSVISWPTTSLLPSDFFTAVIYVHFYFDFAIL